MIQMKKRRGLSWGIEVGLEVVEDEEVEKEEEDMEVAQIFNDAKARHRKIMTAMYTM